MHGGDEPVSQGILHIQRPAQVAVAKRDIHLLSLKRRKLFFGYVKYLSLWLRMSASSRVANPLPKARPIHNLTSALNMSTVCSYCNAFIGPPR